MRDIEHQHAVALVQWWAYFATSKKIDPRLLFAIPNGGKRHPVVAIKMKLEGARAGVPDYFLAIPKKFPSGEVQKCGLFIELKSPEGRPSKAQEEMMDLLSKEYICQMAYGWEQASEIIKDWIEVAREENNVLTSQL